RAQLSRGDRVVGQAQALQLYSPEKLVPRERQGDGRNAGSAGRMRGSAAAMVNGQRCTWKEPAMGRLSEHEYIFGERDSGHAGPARVEQDAFPFQGLEQRVQQGVAIESHHAAEP